MARNSSRIPLVLLGDMIDQVLDKTCYNLKHICVQKFRHERFLKSTEHSKAIENEASEASVTKNELAPFSHRNVVTVHVITIESKTQEQIFFCTMCKTPVI